MPATTIREEGDDRFKPTHCPDNRRRGGGDGSRTAGVCPGATDKRPARRAGGGLNSRIAVWANAVINIPEEFKNDFRVITMDQRNATGGESTGPVPVDDPWGAFADDQLGLMDHLGIRQFFFFGNCIGGPFAMKLMERAPQRVVAALLSQPVGHRPEQPDYMFNSGRGVWAKEFR